MYTHKAVYQLSMPMKQCHSQNVVHSFPTLEDDPVR